MHGRTNFAKNKSYITNTIHSPFNLYQMLKEMIFQMIFDFKGSDKNLGQSDYSMLEFVIKSKKRQF